MPSYAQMQEWLALAEAATEGPWETDSGGCCVWTSDGRSDVAHVAIDGADGTRADAAFIAAARTAVPELIGMLERAAELIDDRLIDGIAWLVEWRGEGQP